MPDSIAMPTDYVTAEYQRALDLGRLQRELGETMIEQSGEEEARRMLACARADAPATPPANTVDGEPA
jgi:hypothetical protein